MRDILHYCVCCDLFRIKILPPLVFENLNSLETLNLQNNRLTHIPEEVTENIVDTLRHIDMTGNASLVTYSIFNVAFLSVGENNFEVFVNFSCLN